MSKNLKIEITEPCFVDGEAVTAGKTISIDEGEATHMVGSGRAKFVEDGKAKPESKSEK